MSPVLTTSPDAPSSATGPWWADVLALKLIKHTPLLGRLRLLLLESCEDLLARGRIAAHRRIPCPQRATIDTWVLSARGRHSRCPRGTAMLIHGLWDSKAFMFPLAQRLAGAGFDAVLADLRGHGLSTGKYVTYGAREVVDLCTVREQLAREGLVRRPLFVVGFSMGGGIAVQFAATQADCRGLVALAPVASADRIMRRMLKIICPLLGEPAVRHVLERAGRLAGFDPWAVSAVEAARGIRCPALVLHGHLDLTVPLAHGRAIYEALAGPRQIVTPWASHSSVIMGREDWLVWRLVQMAQSHEPYDEQAARRG